jgi:hypothetical protein
MTKGAFHAGCLKANFRPFVAVGVTTRDNHPGLKENFARETNISLFLAHLFHSFLFEH